MADNKKTEIIEKVASAIREAVEECGCTLWDVDLKKEDGELTLIICIDRPDGISLTECEMVNDAVNPIIDALDPIEENYCLEVSSPGLERELKTPAHIEAFLGETVKLKLRKALEGKGKTITAKLVSYDEANDTVTVLPENETETLTIERAAVSSMKTVFDFSAL